MFERRVYVSTKEAPYFNERKLLYLDEPPVQGDYYVGDLVISSIQHDNILGWVCVVSGNPGNWEPILNMNSLKSVIENVVIQTQGNSSSINTINARINQLAEVDSALDAEHKAELSKLNNRISINSSNITIINEELTRIKNNADGIQEEIEQAIDGINAQVQLNKNNIQINSDGIAVLEGKQVTNEKEIQDIKNINDQQTADIKEAYDEIGELATQVATNTENIADMNEILKIVEKDLGDTKVKVNEVETGMKDDSKEIDDIKKGIVSALVSSGINTNENMSWEELFGLLLQGLVKPEEPNDPIEILIDEITIKVGETYDATKLYTLQEGYNVQYRCPSILAIEGEHTIVVKGVGTAELEIICGEIIKTVTINVVEGDEPENKECTSIRFNESSLKIHIDQVTDLNEILIIQPDGCTDPVEWVTDNTLLEMNNGVIKGLAEGSTKVQAKCGDLSANINITVVTKITEDLGEGLLLYKAGTQYNDTEFRNLCLTNEANNLTSNSICYYLTHSSSHVWFSYDGYINYGDYDRVEITAYTEYPTQQPVIGLGITTKSGQCGCQSSSTWEGTSLTDLTLMYNVTETKYSLPINYNGSGYLLIWMNHANTLGRVYITEIRVIPKKTENDDPIEIIDDEITIHVGEKYDATKLYTLQKGYNVQYKYASIIAIEGEHTIVGKEVGTTELQIICGGIIKTVTINVVANGDQEGDENIPCTGITCDNSVTVDNENVTPENGGGQLINVTVTPANTTDIVTCTVHNPSMVYVECINGKWYVFSNGINQSGTTVITFKCGGCSSDCFVTVN